MTTSARQVKQGQVEAKLPSLPLDFLAPLLVSCTLVKVKMGKIITLVIIASIFSCIILLTLQGKWC